MATITSARAGAWSSASTWTGGKLPTTGDDVTITHAITYDLYDRTTMYGRVSINTGGSLTHDSAKTTAILCNKYIYINGGRYQAGPNSSTLFHATSNSSTVEGIGLAGIYAVGGISNTQLVLEGSSPLPETPLTQAVPIGAHLLAVADASGFSKGEFISVYHDQKDETTWDWTLDSFKNDEGFIVHGVSGNNILIRQRVAVTDVTTRGMVAGNSRVTVENPRKWQTGFKVFIDNEVFTIDSVDETTNELTFTAAATMTHLSGAEVVETGAQKEHAVGDHVYKIATVTTANTAANSATVTVANAAMLNVGDRIVIEGNARLIGKEFEAVIAAKSGNTLTLDKPNPNTTATGFIVTKSNRDCLVSTSDYDSAAPSDANRCFIYFTSGSTTYINRKCVLRYVEVSRVGHATEVNGGLVVRSDFSRTDTEREIRGCVVRDGRNAGRTGMWLYSANYFPTRNNLAVRTMRGFNPYDQSGGFCFNNIAIGQNTSSFAVESQLQQTLFQYNIGLNSNYAYTWTTDYNASYPEWHNLFRHHTYGLYTVNASTGQQYGSFMKNQFEDLYYRQGYTEGIRTIMQDISISYSSNSVYTNWSSAYADYDGRGLVGGMMVVLNKDFIRGNFEMYSAGGIIQRDNDIQMGNGWSYRYDVNHATYDLRISQMVYVKYGVPVRVIGYLRKDAAYNGTRLPYLMAKGVYQTPIFAHMENVNNEWVRVELNFTPARSEMIQIGVGGRGTAGYMWADPRVSVTTHDLDLIQGPYSVNLMFGLNQIYQENPGVVLGGITI